MKASVYLLGRFDKSHHSIANIPIYLVFSGHDFSTHFFNPRNRLNPRNRWTHANQIRLILNHWKRLNRNKAPPSIFQKWLTENKIELMLSPENNLNSENAIKLLAPKISNIEKWSRLELRAEIIIASFQSIQVVVVQAIYIGELTNHNVILNSSNVHDKTWRRIDWKIHAKNPEICYLQKRNFLWKFSWKINSRNGFLYIFCRFVLFSVISYSLKPNTWFCQSFHRQFIYNDQRDSTSCFSGSSSVRWIPSLWNLLTILSDIYNFNP